MLFLYPKNTTDFTNNGDPIHHSYDEHVIRDDGFYLTFNLLLDKEEGYKKVKKEMIIGANTPDGPNQFRVYDVKKKNTHVEVTAVQLMYDFDNKEVNPFSIKNATGNQVITKFRSSFKSSLGQFTMDSSVTEAHDFATNDEDDDTPSHNALEVLNRITDRWDSELMLNGFDIRMIKRLGAKTDALLYEKKNISEFEDSSSVSGMATRIHATSKFTPEGKENEVTLSVTVDSPLINEYAQVYEKSYVNSDCRTEAELIAWANLKYSTENIDKPSRSITVATNIIDGTEINYGDDLVLKYLVHDVDEVIRCVGYDYDPIRKTYYSVTLGDWKDSFLNTVTSNIVDSTNKQLNQLKKNVTYVLMSANGKNRNAYGPEPVPNPINGDQWYYYELDRPNDVELRVYQDGFWVKFDFFATKNEVEAAVAEIEEVRQSADDAVTKADTAIQEAGFANDAAETAKSNAIAALTEAEAATDKFWELSPRVETAFSNANTALSDAGEAYWNAGEAIRRVGLVEVTTGSLTTSFNELTQTVGLKADKTIVDGINQTVTQQGLDITANATGIASKADKSVVDLINGTVTEHATKIEQTATALTSKAEQSEVNLLKGTVSDHTTSISQNATAITSKASQSSVNTLSGTVSNHTTLIGQNASAISARLTEAQVNTLLGTKNYVNQTTLNATANGLSASISQVSTDLNNLEIGGRNLWVTTETTNGYNSGSNVLGANAAHQTMKNKINVVGPSLIYQVWNPKKISNTSNTNRIAFFDANDTYITTINIPNLNGVEYQTLTIVIPSNAKTMRLGIIQGPFGGNKDDSILVKFEFGTKATDWSPAPEDMATLEKFTTLEATVNGINTVVGNKADKSQITQLAGQISSKVESSIYNSKMTQLDNSISARVQKGELMSQINIQAGRTLISTNKLYLDSSSVVFSGNAFIPSAAITTLDAGKITAGTLNAANVNIINLNANAITAGTINGANSSWNLNTGVLETRLAGTNTKATLDGGRIISYSDRYGTAELNGGRIDFDDGTYSLGVNPLNLYFAKGNNIRNIFWNSEGLSINPGPLNAGTDKNTSLHLIGGGTGSHQYIQFSDNATNGITQRITALDRTLWIQHANNSGRVEISNYNRDEFSGDLYLGSMIIKDANGNGLRLVNNRIENVNRTGTRDVMISPAGRGNLLVKDPQGTWYGIHAYALYNQSSRKIKTNIIDYNGSGLEAVNRLNVVEYNMKQDLARGINERKIGFIAEDSPYIASKDMKSIDSYKLTSLTVKAVQELDQKVVSLESIANANTALANLALSETEQLRLKIEELENKIHQLESAA